MKVSAHLHNIRISPRKVRLVAGLIKGLDAREALRQLDIRVKRGSTPMKKLLMSAMSNGENNFGVDKDNLYVYNVLVGAGPTLKRWMPKAYGRAGQIRKRTSSIELVLEERVEGKNRKSKEQLEQERQKRIEEKRKAQKIEEENARQKEKTSVATGGAEKQKEEGGAKGKRETGKGAWVNKIFRRKSM